jgi:glycogen debranching enzyme
MKKIALFACVFSYIPSFGQTLISDNKLINDAFRLAVGTVDINTRRGILAAGADYGGDWTRDIAINAWNGVSLLRPTVAETSLWSVTIHKDTAGLQYWDKIIWVVAADNHYKVTGDSIFLRQAYDCSARTLQSLVQQTFDVADGLFKGPSVFNDGIAGYPEPVYDPTNYSSAVTDFKASVDIKCLSTNCIYYGAYLALIDMAKSLHLSKATVADYRQRMDALKSNILKHLYDNAANRFYYLIDQNGNANNSQEALGISFAVIFNVIGGTDATNLIRDAAVSTYGITSIYPDFPRYSHDKPGRHNNIIWPMVNGFFAQAAKATENYATFTKELYAQTHLALDEDKGNYDFREIYNPYSGKPDGGWQTSGSATPGHWESCRLQTWSATAYISMILRGVMGLRFDENHVEFEPFLPPGIAHIELNDLAYRHSMLHLTVEGKGNHVKVFTLDGRAQRDHCIPSTLEGRHRIFIEVE